MKRCDDLVRYIDKYRLIEVFIEHEYTVLETYFKSPQKLRLEEIDDVESNALARKPFKKPGLKVNRLPQLLFEGPSLNDDVEVPSFNAEKEKETTDYAVSESNEEDVNKDENGGESNEDATNEDETGSESSKSDDSEDIDYIVDEDNVINEVDVDMQKFYQNIDKDVEWVGPSKGNVEVPAQVDVEECFDLDDFDMDIDCDSDVESSKERKRALRALRKESKNKHGHFYVGQEFADKKEATALVSCQTVATRRQLYVWKNDKLRVRAVCRGKCPNSVGPNASGLNSPNKDKLKQVNEKWVKSKTVETSCSGKGINKVDGIRIKVGEKKGSYVYDTITCPWSLQISKENNTWTIEDIVKPNPSIPVKALKEQLQKKYQVGISIGKVKRARAASIMKVKGDFSEQYSLLRDYVLELQRTNEDTTVKIDLERDYNPSETTRQFKRIYIGRPPKSRKKSASEISSQKMSANGKLSRVASKVGGSHASKVGGSQASSVGGSKASSVVDGVEERKGGEGEEGEGKRGKREKVRGRGRKRGEGRGEGGGKGERAERGRRNGEKREGEERGKGGRARRGWWEGGERGWKRGKGR
ncbi:hypothetical protein Tco_0615039 [Tanacetum coccineum]